MSADAITVVIPTRDRPVELARAVSAAEGQRGVDVEVIVVDDGSRVPVALPQEKERVRVLRTDPSSGVAAARNRGIAAARHDWIAFLDDDDIWSPDLLQRLLALAKSTGATAVKSATARIDPHGNALMITNPHPADPVAAPSWSERLRAFNHLGGPSGVMVRRELLERVGGFDEELSFLADWELWLRLSDAGVIATSPDLLTGYVVHDGSMGARDIGRAATDFRRMVDRYGLSSHRGGPGLYDGDFMRWLGLMYRSGGHRLHASLLFWRTWRKYRHRRDLLRVASGLVGTRTSNVLHRMELRVFSSGSEPVRAPEWVGQYQDQPGTALRPLGG